MSICPYCNKVMIADLDERVAFEPFDEPDLEAFIVHRHCAEQFQSAFAKIRSKKKQKEFVKKLLAKLSAS